MRVTFQIERDLDGYVSEIIKNYNAKNDYYIDPRVYLKRAAFSFVGLAKRKLFGSL